MANSNTEHSKALRAAAANKANKAKLESGEWARINVLIESSYAKIFKSIGDNNADSMRKLIKFYQENHRQ